MSRRRSSTSRPNRSAPASSRGRSGGKLRIIGGKFRRRLLPVPDSPGLRPTPDRVRETLFNWLAFELTGRHVLDLFAGTGALGLEALSRGAREALFVEADGGVARAIEANLKTLDAAGQVITRNAITFLNAAPRPFDIVFLDPPFRLNLAQDICLLLEGQGWLGDHAWIYVETEAQLALEVPNTWRLHREVTAGDSRGRLFRRTASPSGDACRDHHRSVG
ncbi:16S rRNA (guanine(966)-N(2))-methyltransferase RsmD [Halomonas sp. GXIMD04776]|uniref:16S rRNA (guanine(966)-N(2))-methyltransferase RsmD n=1 Tax=Halomonas sp. GXIMD04776 TaxID=3415605 RepID=UPI003CA2A43E